MHPTYEKELRKEIGRRILEQSELPIELRKEGAIVYTGPIDLEHCKDYIHGWDGVYFELREKAPSLSKKLDELTQMRGQMYDAISSGHRDEATRLMEKSSEGLINIIGEHDLAESLASNDDILKIFMDLKKCN